MKMNMERKNPTERPLITFALFAYKQERFIREAVEGAFSQTYEPLEIILSDDYSPDNTFTIMQEMVAAYKGPHKVILNQNKKNLGLAGHINHVVGLSHGEWIVMAAGDDVSFPHRTTDCVNFALAQNDLGGVFCRFFEVDNEGRSLGKPWCPAVSKENEVVKGSADRWLPVASTGQLIFAGCSAMWRRKLWTQFGDISDAAAAEDVILGYRAMLAGMGVGYCPSNGVLYRIHSDNMSRGKSARRTERRFLSSFACVYNEAQNYFSQVASTQTEQEKEAVFQYLETLLVERLCIIIGNKRKALLVSIAYLCLARGKKLYDRLRFLKQMWCTNRRGV